MFIIEGYMDSQKTIESFRNRKIYLESENGELILLTLKEIFKGQMYQTQAIFKPTSLLMPNTKYFLKYSDETKNESSEMKRWNQETKQSEKVSWQTSEINFLDLLNPDLNINFEKNEVIHYGCGPSSNAIFNVTNKNDNEIWYKTEVIEIATNTKTTFYITEWENKLYVGHGMCSGAFTFKNKGKYKVRFTAMNSDGNELKATDWKIFKSPSTNDKWLR